LYVIVSGRGLTLQGRYKHPKKKSRNTKGGMTLVQKLSGSSDCSVSKKLI
jgi:hypothetical protein